VKEKIISLVLKICKLPKKFDEKLESSARKALYAMLFIHLGFSIWIYGNSEMFGDTGHLFKLSGSLDEANPSEGTYILTNLVSRASKYHNFMLTALFMIYVGAIVVTILFKGTFERIIKCCCKHGGMLNSGEPKYENMANYYDRK
jgi:hypothetical protein